MDIRRLADLAKLQLTNEEIEKYEKQIGETLEYIENLKELDTSSVTEAHHTTNLENIFFEDGAECERKFTNEEATVNAKSKKDGSFIVNRIL